MEPELIGLICIFVGVPIIYGLFFVCLSAYYRVKYVAGTRRKFRIQIEQILEKYKVEDNIGLIEDLTELITGYKEIK